MTASCWLGGEASDVQGSKPTVIFIGAGITPRPAAADKTFLLQLAPRLRRLGLNVRIVSIIETPPDDLPDDMLVIPRFAHRDSLGTFTLDTEGRVLGYHHQHPAWRQTLELASTLMTRRGDILRFSGNGPATVFYWMDLSTLVPVLRRTVARTGALVAGLPQFVPSGPVGDRVRARVLTAADAVFAGTETATAALRAAGCACPRLVVAPWGAEGPPAHAARTVPPALHLLWTGFIRQIGHDDFLAAVAIARDVVKARSDIEFTFCLKPQSYRAEYAVHATERVHVVRGDAGFSARLPRYSALFSPVLRLDSTIAPPLSWIQALAAGLPIITTRPAGVGEVLTHGSDALLASDAAALRSTLLDPALAPRLAAMRPAARALFEERYDIDRVAENHADLFRSLIASRERAVSAR